MSPVKHVKLHAQYGYGRSTESFTSQPRAASYGYFAVSAVYMCVRTYHVGNNYVTYIAAMRPYFSRLWQFRRGVGNEQFGVRDFLISP